MGNYLSSGEVTIDKGDMTDAQIDVLIGVCERFVEWYCQEIFYKKSWQAFLDGNNRRTLNTDFDHDIVACTKIESVSVDGTLTELDSTGYVVYPWHITKRYGVWTHGEKNYKFTGYVGNDETDLDGNVNDWYKPNAIKEAVRLLVINIIDEMYDTEIGAGGTAVATTENRNDSEKIGDYSYTLRKMQQATLESNTPTGIFYIDNYLLPPYIRRDPDLGIIFDNPEEYIEYSNLYEVLFQ